jgi:hypothetical protein
MRTRTDQCYINYPFRVLFLHLFVHITFFLFSPVFLFLYFLIRQGFFDNRN